MKGWEKKTIGELCDAGDGEVKTGPFGSQLHQHDYQLEGTPVVMPADIVDGKFDVSRVARVSDSHVERLHKHKLSVGDIVYGRRGDIGRQALVRAENEGWLCGTGCLRISLGNAAVLPKFLHLYLSLPDVAGWVENQAVGATMPNLNTGILRRVPVYFPESKKVQHKIAGAVFAYDDLIENNKRRIALLEKMAEEVYREWFVRLRFPGHGKVKVVKGVPDGWQSVRFAEVCRFEKGKNPAELYDCSVEGVLPYINVETLENKGNSFAVKSKNSVICTDDDVLMLMDGARSGVVFRGCKGIVGSTFSLIKMDAKLKHLIFEYLKACKEAIVFNNTGSAIPHANKEFINRMIIFIPKNSDLIDRFNHIYQSIFEQKRTLELKNINLNKVKDILLTRLISGKLSVENLDIQFPPGMKPER